MIRAPSSGQNRPYADSAEQETARVTGGVSATVAGYFGGNDNFGTGATQEKRTTSAPASFCRGVRLLPLHFPSVDDAEAGLLAALNFDSPPGGCAGFRERRTWRDRTHAEDRTHPALPASMGGRWNLALPSLAVVAHPAREARCA